MQLPASIHIVPSIQRGCRNQYRSAHTSTVHSALGSRGLRSRTCVNIAVLAKPQLGRKTILAFIKPLCVPSPEREAQPAGRRAAGTKLTQELETQLFLLKQSTSELQQKNQAQCSVFHVREIASIGGNPRGQFVVPVTSHCLTLSVPMDLLGQALPSCE